MNAAQTLVSEYVRNNSPIQEDELRNYLKDNKVSENKIKRVLIDEITEHTLPSGVNILSPFEKGKILPSTLKYKALTYDDDILAKEIVTKRLTGLIPPDSGHSCIKRSSIGLGLLPPSKPDTVIPITTREYYFCPTKEDKFKFLQHKLYQ